MRVFDDSVELCGNEINVKISKNVNTRQMILRLVMG